MSLAMQDRVIFAGAVARCAKSTNEGSAEGLLVKLHIPAGLFIDINPGLPVVAPVITKLTVAL
ncbi:hypothetical protein [Marinobacter sp. X15-166B]|uniref:hypothetical protein n=1 Tax=Marinobacter sp. X15-166B TaxID=1897620 RepID=UPI00114D0DCD|nr:hypothetical protein [Marinobacter sp. X15-166B]